MKPTSYFYLFAILLVGFVAYLFFRDQIFPDTDATQDSYVSAIQPGPAGIEIRQAPLYPERGPTVPSGPHAPGQQGSAEEVVYAPPTATDPYATSQESSDHPERLRHPERAYRPPPVNDHTALAVQSGVAGTQHQVSADASQRFSTEMIQNGGGPAEGGYSMQSDGAMEVMPGVFANDTFSDTNYTMF